MGVFARLLRRSKATEEASTAEAKADTPTAEPAAQEAAEAKGSTEVTAEDAEKATATEADTDTADEGVEIPKQQSADGASDREAGEGART